MNFWESFELGIKNIFASKMRAFLTMLGIIIGVGAVIVIMGLGSGMEQYMSDQFASMGTNTLQVMVMGRGSSRSVSVDEMYALVEENPDTLSKISPLVELEGKVKIGTETDDTVSVGGVSEDYLAIKNFSMAQGRFLTYLDISQRTNACVLGSYVADTYFRGDAIGQMVKIAGRDYEVVGVLAQETDGESQEGGVDDLVYLPYSTAARNNGSGLVSGYVITIPSEERAAESKKVVENALYKIFGDEDSYMVISMTEMLDMMSSMININITILTIIAGISLVVGGIGIMNIMLVSVTERTREIGIRKALGAKERYIMSQFVIEAATTSAIGGILGIVLGYLLSAAATLLISAMMQVNMAVTPTAGAVAVSFGISAAIGIVFGYLPAKKAARLNPIDALRYE